MKDMKIYLENLITEKGKELEDEVIQIDGHFGITFEVLIEYIVAAKQYHKQIRDMLVKIDFKNGDVFHYLKHLATGMVKQYESDNIYIKAFEVGKTYVMSWAGDSELKTPYTVIKRTAKTVTVQCRDEKKVKLCRISIYENVEQISPTGKYSMSPTLCADKEKKHIEPKQKPVNPARVHMMIC